MKIAVHSERNMRRALLMLEAARVQAPVLTPDQVVQLPDWELYVCKLAREIMQTQSPQQVWLMSCACGTRTSATRFATAFAALRLIRHHPHPHTRTNTH